MRATTRASLASAGSRWCALTWKVLGAALGMSICIPLVSPPSSPFLLASLGGSAVFLFGLSSMPAAQPRALIGGHLGCALIGVACYKVFGDWPWVSVLALALSMAWMLASRTVHPPAGANALLVVSVHADWGSVLHPVAVGVGALFVTAFVWTRLRKRAVRYPSDFWQCSPPRDT